MLFFFFQAIIFFVFTRILFFRKIDVLWNLQKKRLKRYKSMKLIL